jgi:hypothetical protein
MRLLIKTLFGAAALVLTAGPVQATSFFNVDGQLNGPDPVMAPGNAPLNTGITVHAGFIPSLTAMGVFRARSAI